MAVDEFGDLNGARISKNAAMKWIAERVDTDPMPKTQPLLEQVPEEYYDEKAKVDPLQLTDHSVLSPDDDTHVIDIPATVTDSGAADSADHSGDSETSRPSSDDAGAKGSDKAGGGR